MEDGGGVQVGIQDLLKRTRKAKSHPEASEVFAGTRLVIFFS